MVLLWSLEILSGPRPPRERSWWLQQFQAHDYSGQGPEGTALGACPGPSTKREKRGDHANNLGS